MHVCPKAKLPNLIKAEQPHAPVYRGTGATHTGATHTTTHACTCAYGFQFMLVGCSSCRFAGL